MFQSLFCWTAESNYSLRLEQRQQIGGFNPCFVGQQNQTLLVDFSPHFFDFAFQSLFCWTAESNPMCIRVNIAVCLFQSLFCWTAESNYVRLFEFVKEFPVSILVLLDSRIKRGSSVHRKYSYFRFNPCFVGQQNQTNLVVFQRCLM